MLLGLLNLFIWKSTYPTNVLSGTPFMTYINSYMFRHRGAILRESL
jgi:hypothetical protein